MYAACCLRFLTLLFWPLLTIPGILGAVVVKVLDFFLQDSGFGPLVFLRFGFFTVDVDDSAFPRDSNTDFSYLVGCTFSAPIYINVIVSMYRSYINYLFSLITWSIRCSFQYNSVTIDIEEGNTCVYMKLDCTRSGPCFSDLPGILRSFRRNSMSWVATK